MGPSYTVNAFTPIDLYRDYGICAYNLGMEAQPMLSSYYWAEETYRLHSQTLKTIILDVSMMRRTPEETFFQKDLDAMKFSPVKIRAVMDHTESFNDALSYLIPFFEYHSRWDSITKTDFTKIFYDTANYVRGYNFTLVREFDNHDYDELDVPAYYVDDEATEKQMNESSLYYLRKLIFFCKEHNIKLVMTKTPTAAWASDSHNAIKNIANQYGLDFIDFNYEPYIDEIAFNEAVDTMDTGHMNYYGAKKLTSWFGRYLMENCEATDVRGDAEYGFMDEELAEYDAEIVARYELEEYTGIKEYFEAIMSNPNWAVFITAKDDAAYSLTEETRALFKDYGLTILAEISYRSSYYGVIDSGEIIAEETDIYNEETDGVSASVDNDIENAELSKDFSETEPPTISYKGKLGDGAVYKVTSGGVMFGNTATCTINGTQYSPNSRGLNFVIYDKSRHEVVDTAVFDTCAGETKESGDLEAALSKAKEDGVPFESLSDNLQKLYLYNERCLETYNIATIHEKIGGDGAYQFIKAYMSRPDTRIFIAVQDDAATALDVDGREAFAREGLITLSKLEDRDSYIGIIEDGEVIFEQKDQGELPIIYNNAEYSIESGGWDSGNISSIMIKDVEYSEKLRGLNIVIYDTKSEKVIDQSNYDTFAIGINLNPIDILWEGER